MSNQEGAASADSSMGLPIVCYVPTMITTNGIWLGDNPFAYSLPLIMLQLILIVVTTRFLVYALKPVRQPRVVAEILAGVILGPSVLGRSGKFTEMVFPLRSVVILETMANVGLLYFLFLVGVEMDIRMIMRAGRKAFTIAIGGMVLPFVIGVPFAFILHENMDYVKQGTFILFLGVVLSDTAFPVLARVLAELKLLNTDIGRLAMSSALINEICGWVVLAIAIAMAENYSNSSATTWVIVSSIIFVAICVLIVRPIIVWMIKQIPEGGTVSEFQICVVLAGVMACGFITDSIGTHSVFGAFIFGLIIPKGALSVVLIERLEDFVSGLLLPLFYATSGLRTNIFLIREPMTLMILGLVIVLAFVGKIVGTIIVCRYLKVSFQEGLTLGFLMNTKGLVEMIVLNVGKEQKVFDDQSFAIMVIVAIVMTSMVLPGVTLIQKLKPGKKLVPYKIRTIQETRKSGGEFRILVCVHTSRNVPTIIQLLETSHPTKQSPIRVYALHLAELTGRTSAMLIAHNNRESGCPALFQTQAQSGHIIHAFEVFEQQVLHVSTSSLTAISRYSTMHEDICSVAEDKRVAMIIIPFHKQQTVDGEMKDVNLAFQEINQNVLSNAPCSVGILIDRGLDGSARLVGNQVNTHHVVVLFLGGSDDREGLEYGYRMSEHPGIHLTVMRILPGETKLTTGDSWVNQDGRPELQRVLTERDRDKDLDEECLKVFKGRVMDNPSVTYLERVVNHGEETVAAIKAIDNGDIDLFIVGKGHPMSASPVISGIMDWSECPELGAIGDLLASSDSGVTYSVLVVQQYATMGDCEFATVEEKVVTLEESDQGYEHFGFEYQLPPPPQELSVFQPHFEQH